MFNSDGAAPDLKPIADILAPLVAKMAEPDNQSVSTLRTIPVVTPGNDAGRNQQMVDAALWVEWQRKRGEGATKTEFSLEKGITVMELQTALDRHRDAKNGIVKTDATPTQTNAENIPPEGGMTTRGIIARKLNRTTATLRGWERDGVAPGGIPWPKGIRQGTTILYRVADVWPSLLKMTPDRDNAKDKQLLWEIIQIKEGEEDSDDGD